MLPTPLIDIYREKKSDVYVTKERSRERGCQGVMLVGRHKDTLETQDPKWSTFRPLLTLEQEEQFSTISK